jgi:hypothetical protein
MIELIKLSTGDAALVVNDSLVMAVDPVLDDVRRVESVAQNLSGALYEVLVRVEMSTPEEDGWTWEELIEKRAVDREVRAPW